MQFENFFVCGIRTDVLTVIEGVRQRKRESIFKKKR